MNVISNSDQTHGFVHFGETLCTSLFLVYILYLLVSLGIITYWIHIFLHIVSIFNHVSRFVFLTG